MEGDGEKKPGKEQSMSNAATRLSNERLRQERQRRGWSREYVAEQIGIADVKTIGRWERGIAFPRAYFLQKLCALFGMLAQDLGLYQEESCSLSAAGPLQTSQDSNFSLSTPRLYDPTIPLPRSKADGLVGRDEFEVKGGHSFSPASSRIAASTVIASEAKQSSVA